MKECIDIFSRLLITTITFIVPIFINLLSTFIEGEKRRKKLALVSEEDINRRTAEEVQKAPNSLRETVSRSNKEYEAIDKLTKKELRKLNPIIQFWYIFSFLAASLLFLLVNYLIRSNTWSLYTHRRSIYTLSSSVILYFASLFFIIRILYTISSTKKIIDNH